MTDKKHPHPDRDRFEQSTVTEIRPAIGPDLTHECSLSFGDVLYGIGRRVVKWYEPGGFDGYVTDAVTVAEEDRRTGDSRVRVIKGPRYSRRGNTIASQIVVHHSGGDGPDPRNMYHTLWYDRGLSVQFAVEDDGTIYQFLDADLCAWHAGKANRKSIGIEAVLFPDYKRDPGFYKDHPERKNQPHSHYTTTIQGVTREVFEMPRQQVYALADLCAGLWEIQRRRYTGSKGGTAMFSDAPRFPRGTDGRILYGYSPRPLDHIGLLGHFHITRNKWDPAGLDLAMLEDDIATRLPA